MESIYTLIPDIQEVLKKKSFSNELAIEMGHSLAQVSVEQLTKPEGEGKGNLRLSGLGSQCPKALWYSIHRPDLAEPLPPWAEFKYLFGHIIEVVALKLAKAAGHRVEGEQDEVSLDGVIGHRDAVLDGCVVDVKSCSSRQFIKYKTKTIAQSDGFGYLDQLDGYVLASANDDLVKVKDKGYILAIDKTLGHMVLYEHFIRPDSIRRRIAEYRSIVNGAEPPACTCGTVPQGKSGNIGLDVRASYSPFKYCCFPKLRTFLYASGPEYLVSVVRKPDVLEIDRLGKPVY